jgi:hypothetical protein
MKFKASHLAAMISSHRIVAATMWVSKGSLAAKQLG